jgi:uncharacterized protein YqhQ
MNLVEIAMDIITRNKQIAKYRFFQVSKNTRVYIIATRLIGVQHILCFVFLLFFFVVLPVFQLNYLICHKLVSHRRDSSFECFIDLRVDVIYMFFPLHFMSRLVLRSRYLASSNDSSG